MSNGFKFGWRIAAIAVLCVILGLLLSYSIKEATDYLEARSYGQNIEDYDFYLYDGKYARMRERLGYGNPQGEEFALYWDVADAYWYYELCEFWRLAAADGSAEAGVPLLGMEEGAAGIVPAGEEAPDLYGGTVDQTVYEEKYRERLRHIYENSTEEARRYIRGFAGELLP